MANLIRGCYITKILKMFRVIVKGYYKASDHLLLKHFNSKNCKSLGGLQMIWTIIGILILAWLLGLIFEIAGGLIHILLVIALVVFIARMIKG
ncbi:lmo0937 family membrane protein, partial [Globicatella sulfidifaciens]